MNKNSLHIFPFFSKYKGVIKIEHCDLTDNEIEIRGLPLIKIKLDKEETLYLNNRKIEEDIFYWKININKIENSGNENKNFFDHKLKTKKINDLFEKGLYLTKKGIGFN